ncbi:ribose-5-phosphate isomerase RpiA [Phenylobacterium sp.]|jgi:ribose 5-phosphate isomerase A|uniref:ribose-5-phosphate isomerase RpiA n=1 Tax=Phenylobacterium sp. TaxID=1871053 RepID=UPI002F922014
MSDADAQKQAVGEAAARLVESGMVVGLGTGSTAAWFVRQLAERKLDVTCVATSVQTEQLAAELGLKLAQLGDTREIDLTVDGADEIGPGLSLIKGGGAALLREKLVWEASRRCVVIGDAAKVVPALGKYPLPIEVVAFGHKTTSARICDVLAEFEIGMVPRLRMKDGHPVRTDGGNLIYDAACGRIEEPAALAAALKSLTGVVDHGLFLDLAELALIGGPDGVSTLEP